MVAAVTNVGCAGVGMPQFFGAGSVQQQRAVAERFDPYPENDTAPSVGGGRPLGYEEPIAEPSRSRWNPQTWYNRYNRRPAY